MIARRFLQPILIFFLLVPPLILIWFECSELDRWYDTCEELKYILEEMKIEQIKNTANAKLAKSLSGSNPKYLECIEGFELLSDEIKKLQNHLTTYPFLSNTQLQKRVEFLLGQNKIIFNRKGTTVYPLFEESTEILSHPLQVSTEDVFHLLSALEYPPEELKSPQLLISDFSLVRKNIFGDRETFEMNLKIIKREFP